MHKQGSPEWLQARLGVLTGSRAAAAFTRLAKGGWAKSRESVMYELLAEQLTGQREEIYVNKDMQWGRDYECDARRMYEVCSGNMVDECGLILHPTIDGLGASPDGLVETDGALELKCPKTTTHLKYICAGVVPEEYIFQMDTELVCAQRKWCDFVSFDPRILQLEQMYFCVRYQPSAEYLAAFENDCRVFIAELDALKGKITGVVDARFEEAA